MQLFLLFSYHSNTVLLDVNSQRVKSERRNLQPEAKNRTLAKGWCCWAGGLGGYTFQNAGFFFLDPTSALDDGYLRAMIPF